MDSLYYKEGIKGNRVIQKERGTFMLWRSFKLSHHENLLESCPIP